MFENLFHVTDEEDLEKLSVYWEDCLCPPNDVFIDPNEQEQLKKHLEKCEYCRNRMADERTLKFLIRLEESLEDFLDEEDPGVIEPGQVWSLLPELGGWDKNLNYVQLPAFLIVNVVKYYCRVLPIHNSDYFLAARDVLINHSGSHPCYAETWNFLAVHVSHLKSYLYSVPTDIMELVFQEMELDFESSQNPAVQAFIDIEMRVANHVATKALGLLMAEYEHETQKEAQ